MKYLITIIVLVLSYQISNSQDYKFGKVSKEELEEKVYSLDSSANAAYLYKSRRTFFSYQQNEGFQLVTEIHERVKIYNQEGFDYANKAISLYKSNSTKEKVANIKAYTYNLKGDKIEETKLKKDGVFKTERSKYYDETKFTLPNIKEGCVVEYEYKIISPFYQNIDEFIFQHDIPIKKLEAQFEAPEYFIFKVNTKGFLKVVSTNEERRDRLTYKSTTRRGGAGINTGGSTVSTTSNIEFTKKVTNYHLDSIPALKEEPYVNNINNYRSSVKYELSYTKFPNSTPEFYSTTWEDVVKTIYESPNFGSELDKSSYYENDVNAIIASESDSQKRIGLIYNFVKSKVKWNGYYGKYTSQGVKKAYKEQVGNVAEINLMLTSMLRHAGLDANPVLLSTRQNGIPLFPTIEGYNYVVSSVLLPTGLVLLDATSKYGTPNILPYRTLNWEGRIIKKNGTSELISLYPKTNSGNTVSVMVKVKEEGNIEGAYRSTKTKHSALSYRNRNNEANKDDFLEKLENKYGGLEMSDFKVTNASELSKPVKESYKFVKESQADIIGDKIYFSPLFFLRTKENPFKSETREFPVDFGYPATTKKRIGISIPEGYKIESVPDNLSLALPDELGSFRYVISAKGSQIQLTLDTAINTSIISPVYYETLKSYFKQLIEKENEQIVLTKT